MTIQEELVYLLIRSGLDISELSRRSGVSKSGVYFILNGLRKNPHLETVEKLLRVLNKKLEIK